MMSMRAIKSSKSKPAAKRLLIVISSRITMSSPRT